MTYDKNTFLPPRHEFNASRTQDSCSSTFKKGISAADIATMKTDVESKFVGVAFIYSGAEFDYDVALQGPRAKFTAAMNYLFPNTRDDIVVQAGRWRP